MERIHITNEPVKISEKLVKWFHVIFGVKKFQGRHFGKKKMADLLQNTDHGLIWITLIVTSPYTTWVDAWE
jgi:hypothetical protein